MHVNPISITHQLLYAKTKNLKNFNIDKWKMDSIDRHNQSKELAKTKYSNHFAR